MKSLVTEFLIGYVLGIAMCGLIFLTFESKGVHLINANQYRELVEWETANCGRLEYIRWSKTFTIIRWHHPDWIKYVESEKDGIRNEALFSDHKTWIYDDFVLVFGN